MEIHRGHHDCMLSSFRAPRVPSNFKTSRNTSCENVPVPFQDRWFLPYFISNNISNKFFEDFS